MFEGTSFKSFLFVIIKTMTKPKVLFDRSRIREVTSPKDFEQLLNVQTNSISELTETYTVEELQAWVNYIKSETANRYTKFKNLGYVDEDNNLIAFVSWTAQADSANVECLYTLAPYRGQQIGKSLLREAEANLKNKTVHVRSTLNAQPFYEKNGYSFTAYTLSRAGFRIAQLEKQL